MSPRRALAIVSVLACISSIATALSKLDSGSPGDRAVDPAPAVRLEAPADRFFVEGTALDVTVAYAAPVRRGSARAILALAVDGTPRERVPVSGVGRHTFRLAVDPLDQPALVSVALIAANGTAAASVRGAGPEDVRKARVVIEDVARLAGAIRAFEAERNALPDDLPDLEPYLASPRPVNPFGTGYVMWRGTGRDVRVRATLPGGSVIESDSHDFTRLPSSLLSDRELAKLTTHRVTLLGTAFESYAVDNNAYPRSLEDLVPWYIPAIPAADGYGRPLEVAFTPSAFTVASRGRDGLPGGTGYDVDVTYESGVGLRSGSLSARDYHDRTSGALRAVANAVASYVVDNNELPRSLAACSTEPAIRAFSFGVIEQKSPAPVRLPERIAT